MIEGAKLSDGEVEALLAGLEIQELASRDEGDVASYAATMETAFAHSRDIVLTESDIALHRAVQTSTAVPML